MAFVAVSLPAPAANGAGAWVDVSGFGGLKTVTQNGNGGVFEPFVTIECTNESVPSAGFSLKTFIAPGEQSFGVACHWMRAVVSNYRGGGSAVVEVGGEADGTSFAELAVPAADGTGAGTDVSALPAFKTIQVVGDFRGTLNIEVSEDGGTTYQQVVSFIGNAGAQSLTIATDFMRVTRIGTPLVGPGTPEVWIGATEGGGGGGGFGVNVQDEGVDIGGNPHSVLNFTGGGVTATDAGGGVATINIPGSLAFGYPATGAEDPNGFVINLPVAQIDTNYAVAYSIFRNNPDFYDIKTLIKTVNSITVATTAAPDETDIIDVTITPYFS